jgi:hypothetical protein
MSGNFYFVDGPGKVEAGKEVVQIESADCDLHAATPFKTEVKQNG